MTTAEPTPAAVAPGVPGTAAAPVAPPTRVQILKNFSDSVAKWVAGGFPVATPEEYATRLATCNDCEHWDAAAFMGTGRCLKCGCSRMKLHAGTSTCPVGKWGASSNCPVTTPGVKQ